MKTRFQREPPNRRAQAPQPAASTHGHQCLEKKRVSWTIRLHLSVGAFRPSLKRRPEATKPAPKNTPKNSATDPFRSHALRKGVTSTTWQLQRTNFKSSEYISPVAEHPTNPSVLDVMHLDKCHVCFKLSFQWKRLQFHPKMYSTESDGTLLFSMQACPFKILKAPQAIGRKCCSSFVWTDPTSG